MKPTTFTLTAVLTAAIAAGCVPDTESPFLVILGNKTPNSNCEIEPTELGPYFGRGKLDLVMAKDYTMGALVKNQLTDTLVLQSRSPTDGRVNVSPVQLDTATITYDFPDAAVNPNQTFDPYEVGVAGTVFSDGGLLGVGIAILNPLVADALDTTIPARSSQDPSPGGTIVAKIQLTGRTLDGSEVKSNEFRYPLNVCKGCLLAFPGAAQLGAGNPNCLNPAGADQAQAPCFIGQDEAVDCRICRQRKPIAERLECEPL